MKKSLLKSRTITELEEKIKLYGERAIEEFLCIIEEKGTPIIEELENDSESSLVTFIYKENKECENVLFVPPVGKENYNDNQMQRILETDLWYITYEVRNDVRFKYYFSPNDPLDNNWDERYYNRSVYDRLNKKIMIFKGENEEDDEKSSYVIMPQSPEDVWTKKIEGVPRGSVEEYKFESENLEDKRRIRVYTPYGYDKNEKNYGFIVLTDGDEYINVLSATEILNNLIDSQKIPPIVAIFIDSTENRMKELKCSDSFGEVIVKELIPWARQNYNISSNPKDAIICGLSLGGLTATYLGLNYSKNFGNVLSQSGSYWYRPKSYSFVNDDCWMSSNFKKIDKLPLKFYLSIGVLETKDKIIDTNINLKDTLTAKGYDVEFQWFKSGHDYLSWGENLANGLISLIGIN
ncbi:alpha/beta hydrolase-fold protein [Clostridium sp.]|uniref:alpha/beta hydrolase-fold protein n=1 Tax=Clostridium sp. TaxID=1506 RepID=UPI003463B02D